MREEDLLKLKQELEDRLKYLETTTLSLVKSLREMASLKLGESDIILAQSQVRIDDSMLERHNREIDDITYSLSKFETNDYGICEMCEDDIAIERLHAKPHARYCIGCREIYEKKEREKENS